FPSTLTTWLGSRLWLKAEIVKRLPVPADRVLFLERTLAQLTSAFLTSPFADAAVLIVDDTGEWAATTIGRGRVDDAGKAQIEILAEIQHPHSLPALLGAVAHHLQVPEVGGLRWLSPLCAYGEPSLLAALREVVRAEADGAYALETSFFRFDS